MTEILHVIDTTGPGGAETVFIDLVSRLDKTNYRPTVVIRGTGWVHDELLKRGIEPIIVDAKGSFNFKYLRSLIRIIRRNHIALIQSHLLGSNVYCSLAGWLTNTPVVCTFHGLVDINNERFLAAKFAIINRLASRIVVVSEHLRQCLHDTVPLAEKKVQIIYNGVDTRQFSVKKDDFLKQEMHFDGQDRVIGAIGNVRPAKAYDVLIQAARLVVAKLPTTRFVIVGDNNNRLYESLQSDINAAGLSEHVFFIGFRDRDEVIRILNGLDIFLLTSSSEGFSIATIEAMACGTPVVVTRSGGPEEIVTDQQDGLLVNTNQPHAIAQSLIGLLENQASRQRLSEAALHTVGSKFSLDAMLGSYERIYRNLIGE